MKNTTDQTVAEHASQSSSAQVVDLGRVQDLTGGNSSGQYKDNSGSSSSNRKDQYGGAGER